MKATLKVEAIGDNTYQMFRLYQTAVSSAAPSIGAALESPKAPYWVAIIYGKTGSRYLKNFLNGKKDYTKANSKGSRGVYIWYILQSGYVYEVSSPVSWKRISHYYCKVTDEGEIVEITQDEVDQWIAEQYSETKTTQENTQNEDWELPY